MKSEIVPTIFSTGSHILITLDGSWLITLMYTFKWLSKAVSLCWYLCGQLVVLPPSCSSDRWLASLCAAFILAPDPNIVPRFHSMHSTHLLFIPQHAGMMTPWLHRAKVFVVPHQSLVNCLQGEWDFIFNDTKFT